MGMEGMFSESAEFDHLLSPMPDVFLKVDQATHKAIIKVDEKGTEAAAAIVVKRTGGLYRQPSSPPIEFTANHPFLFALIQNSRVLFIGRKVQ